MKSHLWSAVACAAWAAAAISAWDARAQGWAPQRNVELVVPSAAGGSLDATARMVHRLWQSLKLVPGSSIVVNRGGGEHAVAYNQLMQRVGDPHHLALVTSVLLTGHIEGRIPVTYSDVTPLAFLLTEYIAFAVRSDSPLKSGRDLVDMLKKEPSALSVSAGSMTYRIALGFPLQAAGVDIKPLKIVVFSGGAGVTATLGGHIDVSISSTGITVPHVTSGKLRVIAVSSPRRMTGPLASAPTWEELGLKGTIGSWRAIVAPKGITAEQVHYWENVLRGVAQSAEFRDEAVKNNWDATFRGAAQTRSFMEAEYNALKSVMTYLGIARQ